MVHGSAHYPEWVRAMLSSPWVQVLANQLRDGMAWPTGCGAPEPFVLGAGNG